MAFVGVADFRFPRVARCALAAALIAATIACGSETPEPAPTTAEGWHEFSGSWTAAGRRKLLQLGPQRSVAVVEVSGSLLLSGASRPALGFRGEAITFADDATGMLGRAVWTDERGEQLYSELTAERSDGALAIRGRFVGGSGRYAGAEGEYAFGWQYLIESEAGEVQGRAVGLTGRVRVGAAARAGAHPAGAEPAR